MPIGAPFLRTEARSIRLPIGDRRSRFGTVSCETHRQALTGLSWFSSSSPLDLPVVSGLVRSGLAGHPAQNSPRRPRLNGPAQPARTPWAGLGTPLRSAPALYCDGLKPTLQVCPRRPSSPLLSGRTPGLLGDADVSGKSLPRNVLLAYGTTSTSQDYSDEPPSNRTSHSHGIRLYGSITRRVVKLAPLARLVRPGLPGVTAHLDDASDAFASLTTTSLEARTRRIPRMTGSRQTGK